MNTFLFKIEKCQNPFLFNKTGKFSNWKVSETESIRVGKFQNWEVSESTKFKKGVRIEKCQKLLRLELKLRGCKEER